MSDSTLAPIIATALLSSGFVTGIFTLISKRIWSPETRNDLARIGNEFAQHLLEEARTERNELRLTIEELRRDNITKEETIRRLQKLADEKDHLIHSLEDRQLLLARKLQSGEPISLRDIFGNTVPSGFDLDLGEAI